MKKKIQFSMKLRFGFSLNLSLLALLCIFALSYVTASNYSIVRKFTRPGSNNFSMIYRTSNKKDYKDIVKMNYKASFLMDSDKLAKSTLSKSVKNNLSEQSLVVYLVESFFRGGTPRSRVNKLLEKFARNTGMSLKFVMADESNRPNLQPYIDAFEEAGVVFLKDYSVLTSANIKNFEEDDDVDFLNDYSVPTSANIDANVEHIYFVDFGELGKKGQNKLRTKLRRMKKHSIEPMVLDDYVRRFSHTEYVSKPRSETRPEANVSEIAAGISADNTQVDAYSNAKAQVDDDSASGSDSDDSSDDDSSDDDSSDDDASDDDVASESVAYAECKAQVDDNVNALVDDNFACEIDFDAEGNFQDNPSDNAQDIPSDNFQDIPSDNFQDNPSDNAQDNPADNAQDNPADNAQDNPADNAQDNPADNAQVDSHAANVGGNVQVPSNGAVVDNLLDLNY